MSNPKIFLTFSDGLFIPKSGQSELLDKAFRSNVVIDANKIGYNDYTKNFIGCYATPASMYISEKYDFNPATFTFNFAELRLCNADDYISKVDTKFDVHTRYYIEDTTKETLYNEGNIVKQIKSDYPCPSIEKCGFYVEEKNWNYLVRNILRNANTLLIGPTGTGKTEIVQMICKQMNLECKIYDMGSMQDPLSDLLGTHRLVNGNSVFDYARFVDDVQKPGVILLDELSRAPLMANNILFPCLDSRRQLPIELADSHQERVIKVHPKCTFIATANIGVEYSGTNEIDAALLNRFLPLQLDYLYPEYEIAVLLKRVPDLSEQNAEKIIKFATLIRTKYTLGELSKSVSTRETIAVAELIADGFSFIDAVTFIISNKYMNNSFDNEGKIVKEIILGF